MLRLLKAHPASPQTERLRLLKAHPYDIGQGGPETVRPPGSHLHGHGERRILLQALHQMRIARRGARIGMPEHMLHGA